MPAGVPTDELYVGYNGSQGVIQQVKNFQAHLGGGIVNNTPPAIQGLIDALNQNHDILYIVDRDLMHYWFIRAEENTLLTDADEMGMGFMLKGPYAIKVAGPGVRVYLDSPLPVNIFLNDNIVKQAGHPASFSELQNSCFGDKLNRYEVFGRISTTISQQRMIISDIIRNDTTADTDDYYLGVLPNSNFVGNFIKYAANIVDCNQNNSNGMRPTA